MKYTIITNQGIPFIEIKSEANDPWNGFSTSYGRVEDGLLICGTATLKTGKRVDLKLRLEGKPELISVLSQLESAKKSHLEEEKRKVTIFLSSRGWGDLSPCEWTGDITRHDAEILAGCRDELAIEHDVDKPDQTDDEILSMIQAAREKWEGKPAREAAARKAEQEDIQQKIDSGFCFSCETWCHGDCGNYSIDPKVKFFRDFRQSCREERFGTEENK
jgi:hypothetical protein